MVALNLQGVWEVLFQVRHDEGALHQDSDISFWKLNLISVTVITVSLDISNTFPNLVKDLNKCELVPQVSQYWTVLQVMSDNTLHSLEVSR